MHPLPRSLFVSRIIGTPLPVAPEKPEIILAVPEDHIGWPESWLKLDRRGQIKGVIKGVRVIDFPLPLR